MKKGTSIVYTLETGENKEYIVENRIGTGSFGSVYKVHDNQGHYYAMKLLNPNVEVESERVQREYISTQQLDHPHIVVPQIKFEYMGHTYLLMQYVKGKTLKENLQEKGVYSLEETLQFSITFFDILSYMQSKQIAHRDIKPSNIIINEHGMPLLIDFGLVRCETEEETITFTGEKIGSPAYIAPELMEGKPKGSVNYFLSDMYSASVVLYELLAGERPKRNKGLKSITGKLIPLEKYLEKRNIHRSKEISQVIMKGLHHNPKKRFKNYEAYLEALVDACNSEEYKVKIKNNGYKEGEENKFNNKKRSKLLNIDQETLNQIKDKYKKNYEGNIIASSSDNQDEFKNNIIKDFFYFPVSCCKYYMFKKKEYLHYEKVRKKIRRLKKEGKRDELQRYILFHAVFFPLEKGDPLGKQYERFEYNYPIFSKIIKNYFYSEPLRNEYQK